MAAVAALAALALCGLSPGGPADGGVAERPLVQALGDAGAELAVDGGAALTPIVPPRLLRPSDARFPHGVTRGGDVRLALTLDERGAVAAVRLVESPDLALGQSAIEAARSLRFSPALVGGRPAAVEIDYVYHFTAPIPAPPLPRPSVLRGEVLSRGNRRPIAGAAVAAGRYGAQTDGQGRFALALPPGAETVAVQAAGFEARSFRETLGPGQQLDVRYRLDPATAGGYETIVRAERERTELSRITLSGAELTEVAGTMGDPFRVIMLLPGVGSLVSGLAYPVVRGTVPAATGYFLDGVEVPILFHLFLGPAVVYPDFIESIDFYPGAPPPEYGRLMGGAVAASTAKPREAGLHASAYVDLINAGAFVEYPFTSTGTTVTAAGRFSYTGWLTALVGNALEPPGSPQLVLNFDDYQLRVDQKLGDGHLRLFAFGSYDEVGAAATATTPADIQTIGFHRVDLRWQHALWGGDLEAGLTYGIDEIGIEGGGGPTNETLGIDEQSVRLRAQWSRQLAARWRLDLGADGDYRHLDLTDNLGGGSSPFPGGVANGSFSGAWAELQWKPTPRWELSPGLRFDNYFASPGTDFPVVEPRLAARWKLLDQLVLKAGAGLYHQPPVLLINVPAVDLAALSLGLQEGVQTTVGAEWTFWRGNELHVDVYVNPILRAVELGLPGAVPSQAGGGSLGSPATNGYAYGLEILLRHPLGGRWFGWIAYSLSQSSRYQTYPTLNAQGQQTGTASGYLPFAFDQTHILNAVLDYRLGRGWTLGGVLHFNTGFPEDGVLTSQTEVEGVNAGGQVAWIPVELDKVNRLPAFFRLDLRVSKVWTFDVWKLEWYFDVLNATGSSEVLGYSYGENPTTSGPPELVKSAIAIPIVIPILGLKATY
ncbi:MAG: TonB-dependent receptor domain-containing protein [Myxococcales bacterium]